MVTVTFEVEVSPTVQAGASIVNTALVSGGDESAARTAIINIPLKPIYLPLTANRYCSDFFDDFSDPNSGWYVVDDEFEYTEYLNGEYRVLTKQAGYFYLYDAPTCSHENYVVEVDARWASEPAYSYGIIFGVLPDFSQYYLFDMNTEVQEYRVLRRDPNGYSDIVPITSASAINSGTYSNHLKVTRDGDQFTLEVNGTVLGTWSDGTINGLTFAGIVTSPYDDQPISDARFDNFSISSINIPTIGWDVIGSTSVHGTESSDPDELVDFFNMDLIPIQLKNWILED
jgi:hypothetical protein